MSRERESEKTLRMPAFPVSGGTRPPVPRERLYVDTYYNCPECDPSEGSGFCGLCFRTGEIANGLRA